MPTEVQVYSEGQSSSDGVQSSKQPARRHGVVHCRRFPVESILVTGSSPRRNRKRHVSFSTELLLETAVRDGDLGEARKLLKNVSLEILNQPCETSGVTFLHQSALNCDADMTQLLLNSGANIESRDVDGWTPLQAAAAMGADACVKVLLDTGADPYSRTLDSQESALDLVEVSDQASVRCVKHLVGAMQKTTLQNRSVNMVRMRDSIASFSSVSTCSSLSSTGSCPSPQLSNACSRSQDSGIDSICSNTPPMVASPALGHRGLVLRETSRLCSAIDSLRIDEDESGSDSGADEYNSKGDGNCALNAGVCRLQVLDSDSDLEADGSGSVLARWDSDDCATSPAEIQTGCKQLPAVSPAAQPSASHLTQDVDMILTTASVARRRRRSSANTRFSAPSAPKQAQAEPHRRLTFV